MRLKSLTRIGLAGTTAVIVIQVLRRLYGFTALDLVAFAILAVMVASAVLSLRSLHSHLRISQRKQPYRGFWGVSGLGAAFACLLSFPVLALVLFFAAPLLILDTRGVVFESLVLMLTGLWLLAALRGFAVCRLEATTSGLATFWPHLDRARFAIWREMRLFHILGPLFAVGTPWLFPFTWFVVRHHNAFLATVQDHLE